MVDDVLYFTTQTSRAIAVDAETGKELWVFDPFPGQSGTHRPVPNRGAAYWEGYSPIACGGDDHKFDKRLFYITLDARLFALDPEPASRAKASVTVEPLIFVGGSRTNGQKKGTTQLRLPAFTGTR
jgi:glucose dehydrogenase